MEISDIESKIREFENKGWIIEDFRGGKDYSSSDYHLISPSGDIFKSNYLRMGLCPLCADYEEDNKEESSEDNEEELCDGSLHDKKYLQDLEDAEELYRLIQAREEEVFVRILEK